MADGVPFFVVDKSIDSVKFVYEQIKTALQNKRDCKVMQSSWKAL